MVVAGSKLQRGRKAIEVEGSFGRKTEGMLMGLAITTKPDAAKRSPPLGHDHYSPARGDGALARRHSERAARPRTGRRAGGAGRAPVR